METSYRDTPWGRRYDTSIPLIYRIKGGALQIYGLFEDRETAEQEMAALNPSHGLQIIEANCVGWDIVGDRVEGRHTPHEPVKISAAEEVAWVKAMCKVMDLHVVET
jgi:hypothetical protein